MGNRQSNAGRLSSLAIGTITTQEIAKYIEKDTLRYASAEVLKELKEKEAQTKEREVEMVMGGHVCPVTHPVLSDREIEEDLKEEFYDAEKMKKIWCTVDSALYSIGPISDEVRMMVNGMVASRKKPSKTSKRNKTSRNKRVKDVNPDIVRSILDNFTIIGKPSVDGIAASVDFGGVEGGFVIKAPKKGKDAELLTHEQVVGEELNKLRAHVPGFAEILGGFRCAPPILKAKGDGVDKNPSKWCASAKDGVRYVLYENVFITGDKRNADFSDFAKTCTLQEWLEVYVFTILLLQFAAEKVGFTHNDLHSENALVRKTSKPLLVPFTLENKTYYMYTDLIPTLIDYGRSNIKIDGEWYADFTQAGFGSDLEGICPYQDAYKLLMFSLNDMQNTNPDVFLALEKVFRFFNATEGVKEVLADQRPFYYVLPYNLPQIKGKGLYDFIEYIVASYPEFNLVYDESIIKEAEAVCPIGTIPTSATCEGTTKRSLVSFAVPETLEQLYNIAPYATKQDMRRILKGFDNPDGDIDTYEELLQNAIEKLETEFEIQALYTDETVKQIDSTVSKWENNLNKADEVISTVREDGLLYISHLSTLDGLYQHAKIIDYALKVFQGEKDTPWVNRLRVFYSGIMQDAMTNYWEVLVSSAEFLYSSADDTQDILEGEFDTGLDTLISLFEPYVKTDYLNKCTNCL